MIIIKFTRIFSLVLLLQISIFPASSMEIDQDDANYYNIIFSKYFGGSSYDRAMDFAFDNHGNIITVGCARSTDFPLLNAYNSMFIPSGMYECNHFVAKFSATGDLIFSTFHGLGDEDLDTRVIVDSNGDIIVSGVIISDKFETKNAYDSTYPGDYSSFLSKFSPDGELVWSTYLDKVEFITTLNTDLFNNIFFTTTAPQNPFPDYTRLNDTSGEAANIGIVKFSPDGFPIASGIIGGSSLDVTADLQVFEEGIAVAGFTTSYDFPILNPINSTINGIGDAFILTINNSWNVTFSTFFGGSDADYAEILSITNEHEILLSGNTASDDCPVTTQNDDINIKNRNFATQISPFGEIIWSNFVDINSGMLVLNDGNSFFACKTSENGVEGTYIQPKESSSEIILYSGEFTATVRSAGIDNENHIVLFGCNANNNIPIHNAYQSESISEWSNPFITKLNLLDSSNQITHSERRKNLIIGYDPVPFGSMILCVLISLSVTTRKRMSFLISSNPQ